MKRIHLVLVLVFIFPFVSKAQTDPITFEKIKLPVNTSIRAIAVINDSCVWFAGSHGVYGFTKDNGHHWHIDSTRIYSFIPEFRSIAALDEHNILLLNSGSPAYIIKSTDEGKSWKTVYENRDEKIFFDALQFSTDNYGMALGDPIDNCFMILVTHNKGDNWEPLSCNVLPKAMTGEACFASSNSCLDIYKQHVWIATGGSKARIFHSTNAGRTWKVYETPLLRGSELSGIFSIDFYDEKHGVAGGGDYNKKDHTEKTKAITNDGGKKWELVSDEQPPPFISCVQFRPGSHAKAIVAASLPGIFISLNGGMKWQEIKDSSGKTSTENYYTLQFSPTGNAAWLAGANGEVAKLIFR